MRVRFRFTKLGKVRFTSHRDVARMWERALRRAALPVAQTEGFSPRPKVHFGLALSTGHESLGEYLDVDFREPEGAELELDGLAALLTPLLPVGVDVDNVAVADRSADSLQQAVTSCTWRIEVPGLGPDAARGAVEAVLAADALPVTRQRKGHDVTDDIRPGILHLAVDGPLEAPGGGNALVAELATQPRGLRPGELLAAFDPPQEEGRVCRTHQWITLDGARREPLPPGATWAPHAEVRAS